MHNIVKLADNTRVYDVVDVTPLSRAFQLSNAKMSWRFMHLSLEAHIKKYPH